MTSFSERMGHRAARTLVQYNSLDSETRTELWNVLMVLREILERLPDRTYPADETEARVLQGLWTWHFKKPRDEMTRASYVWGTIKSSIFEDAWYDVFDLIESLVKNLERFKTSASSELPALLPSWINGCFERNLVGYRFIGNEITPVDSTAEAEAVVSAQEDSSGLAGARHALERAVELLADRSSPDYPNSIKESISAVEAVIKKVTGEGTLGAGLNKLEAAGLTIHPALKVAWQKMYGWTSDAAGIRHAGIEAASVDQALAKYVLVASSAFVSYLVEEGRKKGLLS